MLPPWVWGNRENLKAQQFTGSSISAPGHIMDNSAAVRSCQGLCLNSTGVHRVQISLKNKANGCGHKDLPSAVSLCQPRRRKDTSVFFPDAIWKRTSTLHFFKIPSPLIIAGHEMGEKRDGEDEERDDSGHPFLIVRYLS